jgi:hypothetical protein
MAFDGYGSRWQWPAAGVCQQRWMTRKAAAVTDEDKLAKGGGVKDGV